ncbi:MAG: type II toxin-antitoxin system HicB family antitoxin [Patescibacteria group bacterium]
MKKNTNAIKYNVLLTKNTGGYTVTVAALPGCISQGKNVEEALEHIKEAIGLYLETLAEEGKRLPIETNIISSFVDIFPSRKTVYA